MTQQPTPKGGPIGGQNILDKALAYLAPGFALQRAAARSQLAISGAYTGARIDRSQIARYMPLAGSANSDTIADLPTLRSRSRDQMRNAPVALGALNTTVSHVVGTGLSFAPAIDANFLGMTDEQAEEWQASTKRSFNAWASSVDCDLARQQDFYGLQELAFRSYLESGDAFAVTPRIKRRNRTRLAVQLIEADRVCNPNKTPDTEKLIAGIELDPATGEAIAVQVARKHPGDTVTGNQWDRVVMRGATTGRRNVLHIFKPLRPGQVRGVPWVAPIIEPLKQLQRWSDAELNAAVVSGLMATFVTMDPQAFGDLYDGEAQEAIVDRASKWSGEMESGQAVNLLPGESIESPAPGRPNPAFDPFWQAMVRQIGMALEMPYEVLVMHYSSSYSASRAALLMAWKAFKVKRELLAKTFCQPVYELWLADEVAEGRIAAPGFFADEVVRAAWCAGAWTGDGPGSIDPTKDVQAAKERVELGISTKQAESMAFDGQDWRPKHVQRVKEIQAEKQDGIYLLPAGTALAPDNNTTGGKKAAPEDDSADPKEEDKQNKAAQATADLMADICRRLDALAARPSVAIHNTPPAVNIQQGDTHHHIAGPTVEGHEINVSLPEGCVQLQATVEAPAVRVDVPAPQVVLQQSPRQNMHQVHTRDNDGNLLETVTRFTD